MQRPCLLVAIRGLSYWYMEICSRGAVQKSCLLKTPAQALIAISHPVNLISRNRVDLLPCHRVTGHNCSSSLPAFQTCLSTESARSGLTFSQHDQISVPANEPYVHRVEDSVRTWLWSKSWCNSSYTSQIAASLTPSWKTRWSTTVTGEPSTMKVDGGTKVGVGGGGEVEVDGVEIAEIESQAASCIDTSTGNNSYKTRCKINA